MSLDGGWCPPWNPTGRGLFLLGLTDRAGKIRMMAVEFVPASPPRVGRPRQLFEFTEGDLPLRASPARRYDVAPDGQRFYVVQRRSDPPRSPVAHVNLILNWLEELKAKVPTGR